MSNWRLLTDPAEMVKNAWKTSARKNNQITELLKKFENIKQPHLFPVFRFYYISVVFSF